MTTAFRCAVALSGIHGTIRTGSGPLPVADVLVELDGRQIARSDSLGTYWACALPSGPQEVLFIAPGYETRRVTVFVVDSTDVQLDIRLVSRLVYLPSIQAVGQPVPDSGRSGTVGPDRWQEGGLYQFGSEWRAAALAAGGDVQSALLSVPGVTSRGGGSPGFSVRGGSGSETLVLLDGIPLAGATHFAQSATALNPDAITGIVVHAGVSSVQFGDRLSGVVELASATSSSRMDMTGAVSNAEARNMFRAPLGSSGGSVLLSGRESIRNLLTDESSTLSPNGYSDLLGTARVPLAGGVLGVVAFHSADRLRLEGDGLLPAGVATDAADSVASSASGDALAWQSSSGGLTWTGRMQSGRQLHLVASYSGTAADVRWIEGDVTQSLHSRAGSVGMSGRLSQSLDRGSLLVGFSAERVSTMYSLLVRPDSVTGGVPLARATAPGLGALFAEWNWIASDRISLRAGIRGNTDFQASWNADPRVTMALQLAPSTTLAVGYGRTHQTVQSMLNEENVLSSLVGFELPVATVMGSPSARADQAEVSVVHRLGGAGMLTLQGYARRWTGAAVPAVSSVGLFVADTVVYGSGNAAGIVAGANYSAGPLALRAAVGLTHAVRSGGGLTYAPAADPPWSFNGSLGYRVAARTRAQLALTATADRPGPVVGSGFEWQAYQPATGSGDLGGNPDNVPGTINPVRLPASFLVDLGLERSWSIGVGGRRSVVQTTIRVENLLNQAGLIGRVVGPGGALQGLSGSSRSVVLQLGWSY